MLIADQLALLVVCELLEGVDEVAAAAVVVWLELAVADEDDVDPDAVDDVAAVVAVVWPDDAVVADPVEAVTDVVVDACAEVVR